MQSYFHRQHEGVEKNISKFAYHDYLRRISTIVVIM